MRCCQTLTAEVGELVELRFIGAESPNALSRRLMWTYHTVHMHGQDFYLTNMGFPQTFPNGTIKDISKNLRCLNDQCTKHWWDEEALKRDEVKGDFIAKNTLLLPAQGNYIILQYYY